MCEGPAAWAFCDALATLLRLGVDFIRRRLTGCSSSSTYTGSKVSSGSTSCDRMCWLSLPYRQLRHILLACFYSHIRKGTYEYSHDSQFHLCACSGKPTIVARLVTCLSLLACRSFVLLSSIITSLHGAQSILGRGLSSMDFDFLTDHPFCSALRVTCAKNTVRKNRGSGMQSECSLVPCRRSPGRRKRAEHHCT